MNKKLFDVPNLDDLSVDRADYHTAAATFSALASYCRTVACAMQLREEGDIARARQIEEGLEEMYASLPEWARW